jgi:hypothetical protein
MHTRRKLRHIEINAHSAIRQRERGGPDFLSLGIHNVCMSRRQRSLAECRCRAEQNWQD